MGLPRLRQGHLSTWGVLSLLARTCPIGKAAFGPASEAASCSAVTIGAALGSIGAAQSPIGSTVSALRLHNCRVSWLTFQCTWVGRLRQTLKSDHIFAPVSSGSASAVGAAIGSTVVCPFDSTSGAAIGLIGAPAFGPTCVFPGSAFTTAFGEAIAPLLAGKAAAGGAHV